FIGDSFTEAGNMPEDETYSAQVGKRLGKTSRNLARAGYTTPNELVVLERYGWKGAPKAGVGQIAEANDLLEAQAYDTGGKSGRTEICGKVVWGYMGGKGRSPTFKIFLLLGRPPEPLGGRFKTSDGTWHDVRLLNLMTRDQSPKGHVGWPTFAASLQKGFGE